MRLSGKAKAGGTAAVVLALAVPFIAQWEGKRNYAYQDVGGVWTICYGSTSGVKRGDYKTDDECESLFRKEVGEYYDRLAACVDMREVPVSVQASFTELGYNVGTGAACGSTMAKKIRAGDYAGACDELRKWVNAGGKVVRGLVNRRNASHEMCVRDL